MNLGQWGLTQRGWRVGIGSLCAAAAGRLFGMGELVVLAVGGLVLLAAAVAWTRTRDIRLRIQRSTQPTRIHAGGQAQVDLAITNLGHATPVLTVTDPVTGTAGARLRVGPMGRAEVLKTSYLAPTQRRGRLQVGPAQIEVIDPLGLARSEVGDGPTTTLVVYPVTVALAAPRLVRGPEPLGLTAETHTLRSIGEDFYALRDYSAGDDVRRIHWPSTARLGRPMVREDEVPRRSRITVVLDTRRTAFGEEREANEQFELAVSAAASVILACATRRDPLRLITTAGADTGHLSSGEGLAQLFDHLSDVRLQASGSLRNALAVATSTAAGAVVAIVGSPSSGAAAGAAGPRAGANGRTAANGRAGSGVKAAAAASADAEIVAAAAGAAASLTVIRVCESAGPTAASPPPTGPNTLDISSLADLERKWASAGASTGASTGASIGAVGGTFGGAVELSGAGR